MTFLGVIAAALGVTLFGFVFFILGVVTAVKLMQMGMDVQEGK